MKVRDLIRKLQVHDPDAEVVTHADHGDAFTYSAATYVAEKKVNEQGQGYVDQNTIKPVPAVLIS